MARKAAKIVIIKLKGEKVEAKACSRCSKVLALINYNKGASVDGRNSHCKACEKIYRNGRKKVISERRKIFYEANRDKFLNYREANKERTAEYYKANRDQLLEKEKKNRKANKDRNARRKKEYQANNTHMINANGQRRRARLAALADTLTNMQTGAIEASSCALTGDHQTHIEHYIAISTGHGGSYVANCYAMRDALNVSKGSRNPYTWIQTQPDEIQQRFYTILAPEIAAAHGLTAEQLRSFTNYCYDNQRSTLEALEDPRSSLRIWQAATGAAVTKKAAALMAEQEAALSGRDGDYIRRKLEQAEALTAAPDAPQPNTATV